MAKAELIKSFNFGFHDDSKILEHFVLLFIAAGKDSQIIFFTIKQEKAVIKGNK